MYVVDVEQYIHGITVMCFFSDRFETLDQSELPSVDKKQVFAIIYWAAEPAVGSHAHSMAVMFPQIACEQSCTVRY